MWWLEEGSPGRLLGAAGLGEEGGASDAAAGSLGVSSEGRQGAALGAQRRVLAAACRRRGWRLVEVVEAAGCSAEDQGRASGRPQPRRDRERTERRITSPPPKAAAAGTRRPSAPRSAEQADASASPRQPLAGAQS